ncbi:MAG: tRNA uridine(34) 5-carboxymethylaminomethyl modification radical SAM/GNAT enzyme Elp3 [Candidatus Aenigmarchaeota archaeon]|nr:tRNA uridine(34) 5-carboxymethylaminomethyl modification radical SAM/GNAT enzyme Elp3 [Candidatus Aenigmarchaeota archaeon]
MKKVVRSLSGIVPLSVMLKPYPCKHGSCIYCPAQENVPKSYTKTSPVVMRAEACEYDAERQVKARLKIFGLMGHPTDKIELIVMGGTFNNYPLDYQKEFIKKCFDGANGITSKSLEEAKKINETAKNRIVALCLETRPDFITEETIKQMLDYGCTRVEIGVQTLDNEIHKITNRGHTVEDVIKATKLLKDAGFKIGYHMMLGLPGSTPEKDLETFKTLFSDERFQPDQVKIYPTFVIKGTKLEELYNKGNYKPYSAKQIVDIIVKIKKFIPRYVRIMRVMRDIPAEYIASECVYSHLRTEIKERLQETGVVCNCIRCREVGYQEKAGNLTGEPKLNRIDYDASNGKEIFLSFEDKNSIISLLRLRILNNSKTAIIREIHTFGPMITLGNKGEWQHKGYGKKLMQEAEKIAEDFKCNKMLVISGVGVREYFYKLGYKIDGPYVSKKI